MTKKLVCLVLALLMVLAVLTSCSKDGDAAEDTMNEASRYTTTLNVWMITESEPIATVSELMWNGFNAEVDYAKFDELSENDRKTHAQGKAIYDTLSDVEKEAVAQLGQINKAINKITKTKFKTQLKIRYLTEENYYAGIERAFAERQAAKDNGTLQSPTISADETVLNEYGVPELKYPTTAGYQIDIMYVGEAHKYRAYADNGWLYALDGMISDSAVELTYYINNVLLSSAKYREVTYGVPTNSTIGEYIYLAVDEELAANYGYDSVMDFESSLYSNNCYDFLEYVYAAYTDTENRIDVKPIYCDEDVDLEELNLLHFWSYDLDSVPGQFVLNPETFSLFGGFYFAEFVQGAEIGNTNLLSSTRYQQMLSKKLRYETAENYLTTDSAEKTAVRVVKGGLQERVALEADGYTVLTVKTPRVTDESVFGNMFSVGAFTVDSERCMEVITYINTNAEFRNLLQYGIEGVNYTLKEVECEDGFTRQYAEMTAENLYVMDVEKTGNVFIAYPNSEENVMLWEYGKKQNNDATAYPTVGINFDLAKYKLDEMSIYIINSVSQQYKALLDAAQTKEDLNKLFPEIKDYATSEAFAAFLLEKIAPNGRTPYYTVCGTDYVLSKADLIAALNCMNVSKLNETEGALQSPYALYRYTWLSYYMKVE